MRQIAGAMLMYINANKGHFPPAQIDVMAQRLPQRLVVALASW